MSSSVTGGDTCGEVTPILGEQIDDTLLGWRLKWSASWKQSVGVSTGFPESERRGRMTSYRSQRLSCQMKWTTSGSTDGDALCVEPSELSRRFEELPGLITPRLSSETVGDPTSDALSALTFSALNMPWSPSPPDSHPDRSSAPDDFMRAKHLTILQLHIPYRSAMGSSGGERIGTSPLHAPARVFS